MNNINNVSPVNNITHIAQYSNNLPINSGSQKKISQNLIRNSKDLANNNNIIYQMPHMNNINNISQNKNFQNISIDQDSSISNNINSNIHNIHVINPRNSNENQGNYNSSGKSNPAIIYNPNQNASPNNINNNQNNYSSSGKNNPAINYNLNHQNQNYYNSPGKNIPVAKFYPNRNFSPHNLIQNLKNDNSNSSGKSNLAVYIPSQNIDPNIGNYNSPANNINNIHLIHPPHIVVQNHINIIPIKKPIFSDRRNINQIVITKPVPNDNFNPSEFKILSQIGEGSFGKIYCVQWIKNFEKYAMKKLNLFGQEELIILQHKVKIVQNLQKKTGHNGFTTIYGDKCIPAPRPNEYHYYIIMELVEKDWEVELKRRRINSEFYTEYELLDIVKQLVKTLSIMQQNNVTHRDIKPQNVLIKEGFYKLCDFDEVKIIYNPQPCMHSVRGSELYMAPILFYAYQNKTPSIVHNTYKSDVFSLGMCILLAAGLTAKTLCDIREIKDMNIISEIIISRLFNRYSPNFIKLIIKMLQLEETLRFDFIELEEYILQIWPN
jgi:hypothetical protein